jgi:DNA polymerase (family 10)
MELKQAEIIAEKVKEKLMPTCARIEVAGSIRRRRPFVHDIDLVLIPSNQGQLWYKLAEMGQVKMSGAKLMRCTLPEGIDVDIYVATPEIWATLLLIRTGSKSHNIKLCSLAKTNGMKLHADGSGLFGLGDCEGTETRIAGDTEASIFKALGLAYVPPEKRE